MPQEDRRVDLLVAKAVLAGRLGIQPSEVDEMEPWELSGYLAYIDNATRPKTARRPTRR